MASFGDFNKVNTNVTAMEARLSLNKINSELSSSRLKLSTGFKINTAEDDSAGYAIATKLRSKIAGLEQALQNVSDTKSVLDMVEGAYSSIMDNLIEMKQLATQGANDSMGDSELDFIANQIEGLSQNINDTAKSTVYNGIGLLDGNAADKSNWANNGTGTFTLTVQAGDQTTDTYNVDLNAVNIATLFDQANNANLDSTDVAGDITLAANTVGVANTTPITRTNLVFDTAANGLSNADMRDFMAHVDSAINVLNGYTNDLGIDQRSLSTKEVNLTEAITANSAAKSRIMDVDFAKEQSNSVRLQILQQTATAALSQANMGPQAVLGFLGQ